MTELGEAIFKAGFAESQAKIKLEIAKNLKKQGKISDDVIAEVTGLDISVIKDIHTS